MSSPMNLFALLLVASTACGSDTSITGVTNQCTLTALTAKTADSATAAARWNTLTSAIVSRREFGPLGIARTFALVSISQYNAVVAADASTASGTPMSEAGASAGAAATVLAGLYGVEQPAIDAQLSADAALVGSIAAGCSAQFTAGVAAGKSIGAAALVRAATDRSADPWTGSLPIGAGYWISAPLPAQPLAPMWGKTRPWMMTSGDQFRPVAPPTFGSALYLTALAEVRDVAASRTPEQLRIAQYWGTVVNTSGPAGIWSAIALGLSVKAQNDEPTTARMLAMMHMAAMDASIACWDAKYAFSFIRPFQADPSISTPVGRPNFPSYPSAHSCLSAAYETVLASMYPSSATSLKAQLDEAGVSRIYAGLHFRFDVDAGVQIGQSTGALALARVRDGIAIPLN
jgi:membrane-associated phospholipid phosphatase